MPPPPPQLPVLPDLLHAGDAQHAGSEYILIVDVGVLPQLPVLPDLLHAGDAQHEQIRHPHHTLRR